MIDVVLNNQWQRISAKTNQRPPKASLEQIKIQKTKIKDNSPYHQQKKKKTSNLDPDNQRQARLTKTNQKCRIQTKARLLEGRVAGGICKIRPRIQIEQL